MKKQLLVIFIAIIAVIGLFTTCDNGDTHSCSFGNWVELTPATCHTARSEERTCSCGETETRIVGEPLAHNYGAWETKTEANCITAKVEKRICSLCGYEDTQNVGEPLGTAHNYSEWTTKTEATCVASEVEKRSCSLCENEETRNVDEPLGHQGLTPAFAATCTVAGNSEASGTCTRAGCGQTITGTVIPALGHDWNWNSYISGSGRRECQRSACTVTAGIGHTGPAGGIIFYHDPNGFTMTDTGETAFWLEAAPAHMGSWRWSTLASGQGQIPPDVAGTSQAIGTGRRNTALILAVDATAPAALACRNYSNNGFTDWFLPSGDELNQLYLRREVFGLSSGQFWSSSQSFFSDSVWFQNFANGVRSVDQKYMQRTVRAVRAF